MVKPSSAVPEQHKAMASIPAEETELGIGTRPGADLQRPPGEAACAEKTQLRIHLMEALHNALDRLPLERLLRWGLLVDGLLVDGRLI